MFRLLATADNPQSLADALNERRIELGISQTDLDHISGMASGYCSKIFASQYNKNLGALSLPVLLDALGLRLAVVVDEAPDALPAITRRVVEERRRNPIAPSRLARREPRAAQRERRAAAQEAGTA